MMAAHITSAGLRSLRGPVGMRAPSKLQEYYAFGVYGDKYRTLGMKVPLG
jgi:hypothetical protein